MTHWWRAEDTSIDHPKLLRLSDAMFRAWYTLNCVASANDGVLPPTEDVAVRLRIKPAKVAEWITKLVTAGLYDNEDGVFRPHNWSRRQYKTDGSDPTNSDRQRRYRERHRNGSNGVTDNGSNGVTPKRPEHSRAETDSEQNRADGRALDENGLKQERLLRTTFAALCHGRQAPDMTIIAVWLLDGVAVSTISQTVPALMKRKPDMKSLAYCDAAVREAHAKAGPSGPIIPYAGQVFIVEGTIEWAAWEHFLRKSGGRGSPVCDEKDEHGRITGRRGWPRPSSVPDGYDEATGEFHGEATAVA